MSLPAIFDTCKPRADVKSGATKDEQFVADLTQVLRGTAADEYRKPESFFTLTYPTRGLKELLKAVCLRLSGKGGEVASIIRLGTQYGGGKTHGLIALVHAVNGMKGVDNASAFVDPAILPSGKVRIAALDGENSDPANGLTLESGLRAYSFWGEMAYVLAGREGYERVRVSDEKHIAPGTETIRELFGNEPTLILMDEVSVYLRKVEMAFPGASEQFTAFVHALFKAVSSSPNVALVYTLAVGSDDAAKDAYKEENERAAAAMAEVEKVAARSSTNLNPTEEDETANVLRARLFEKVDLDLGQQVIDAYRKVWMANKEALPIDAVSPELADQFSRSYPLHPKLLEMFKEKTASLSTFQRTRGMLRLLARTVHLLWKDQPADACAIHIHHVDPGYERIRSEINVKLGLSDYNAAIKSDVAAVPGDEPALAQQMDQQKLPGLPPVHSYLARTILWHTFAYGDNARGISPEQLKLAVCSPHPSLEPPFLEQARVAFVGESIYLDDKPGAPLRFMVEANLTMIIRRRMADIDARDVRNELKERIRQLYSLPNGEFHTIPFPAGAYEVPDEVGDGRPLLAVMNYETVSVPVDLRQPPPEVENIFQYRNAEGKLRELRNNLVFVVADHRSIENMKTLMRRRLALAELRKPENQRDLADYQKKKVDGEYEKLRLDIAMAVLQCYRHLFYPSSNPMSGTTLPIGYTIIELSGPGDSPGNGQHQVQRVLHEQKKLLEPRDTPDAPGFVRDQTPLRIKGEITTAALRTEYRKAPKLSILLQDAPLLLCIRNGIEQGVFIYREGNQVWGQGDPTPAVYINDNCFVHTVKDAEQKKLWPRVDPLVVRFYAQPEQVSKGGQAELVVLISGGLAPYNVLCSEPMLSADRTTQTELRAKIRPQSSASYQIEVLDSRGTRQTATAQIMVEQGGKVEPPPPPGPIKPPPPPPPAALRAEGPLQQALTDLWAKARQSKCDAISKLTIEMTEAVSAWKVHQSAATLQGIGVSCSLVVELAAEGIDKFRIEFDGRLDKANPVKSFLEPNIRAAEDVIFTARYTLMFDPALSMKADTPENLARNLTKAGGGEAYVEAEAVQSGASA